MMLQSYHGGSFEPTGNATTENDESQSTGQSLGRHDFGEYRGSFKNLIARFIHADGIIPAISNGEIVDLILVAAEMN